MIYFMTYAIIFLFFILLVTGLVVCIKHSFKAGVYFFLIIMVERFASFFYNPALSRYIVSLHADNGSPPMGLTLGELLTAINLIPRVVELAAFGILVVGIYRKWKKPRYEAA